RATGVLPVCVGKATRLSEFLLDAEKQYRVVLKLGLTTTTQDGSGEVLTRRDTGGVTA
ncbi:MAG: tRNA pseudouridine(55) synthase TruB, partial [Planctomycetales bacterium]|nr:tRNA pseudouridine(55) synthase TruB [Planctomycetales bacterium]